jgi:hypothetical protein
MSLESSKSKGKRRLITFNLNFDIVKNLNYSKNIFKKYNPGQIVAWPEQFIDKEYYEFVKESS